MPRPLTPETLVYGLAAAGDPQLSPDGSRVLYTLGAADRGSKKQSSQLWMCGVDGSDPRQITQSGERNGSGRWSPDGGAVAFVSDRVKKSGLFVLPADGAGEGRELARHAQPITFLAWSPDGHHIAYTTVFDPDNPNEIDPPEGAAPPVRVTRRMDYKQDTRGYLNDVRSQVYLVDTVSGDVRRLTSAPVDHFYPQWSPDGRWLAALVPNRNGLHSQLALIEARSGETRLVGPADGVVAVWAWSPDGTRILFAGDTTQTYQSDFFLYDTASGAIRRLTDDLACLPDAGFAPVLPPAQPVWTNDHTALFHAVRAGRSGLYTINTETAAVSAIASWDALHAGLSADATARYIAQGRADLGTIGEIAVVDRETGETNIITQCNADALRDAPPAQWERLDVTRPDGISVEAWLLKPPDFDPAKQYPVVLDVHGGPNGFYGYAFNLVQQCLASHGFLVVYSNPRGSGSYGRDFTMRVIEDWGGADFQDLMAVVDAIQERPYADTARTGIYGYSYGGYMTAWTIGQTDRFAAAVCGAPVFDCESFYGTSDIGYVFGAQHFGGTPHERREWYAAHSPSTYAHRAKTPTLILHGEADDRCPIGQGEQLFTALHQNGCEVELARYPGGSHLFLRVGPPAHREDFLARTLAWFQSHLGGPA